MANQRAFGTFLLLLFCSAISCNTTETNHDDKFEDGILIEARELLGEDVLNVIENVLDFPIHRGSDPPDILKKVRSATGNAVTVILDPTVLVKSNVENENQTPGLEFADTFMRFSNQNMENFRIKFDRTHLGYDPFFGDESFIIGDGNNFTIFGPEYEEHEEGTVLSVNIFSGTVKEDGIANAFGGIVMIENHGVSGYIANGTGRVFKDGDDFADLDEWPSTGEFQTGDSKRAELSTKIRID